mmetsp:Transcript_32209/g.104195  ORF Transcript_32209/g.104195 Transcript_32209/m.104195 type:complete len:535 (+) Transcript_32209:129-1733(+)
MAQRVRLLRNGSRTGGKLLVVPDTWEQLLHRCSRKFSTDDEPFVASRCFTVDGFEIEELEEVAADSIVVVSSGEDFLPLPLLEGLPPPLHTGVSSSAASTASAAPAPTELSRDSSVASVSLPPHASPLPPGAAAAAEPAVPSPPEPRLHLTMLQAAPLVTSRGSDGAVHPLPQLNLLSEREKLSEMLSHASKALDIAFEIATTDNLRRVCTTGATVLHYSGHGEESYLSFEDGSGASHELTPQLLASTCAAADGAAPPLRLVFVCACHSQPAAAAFARMGVPHVVAVASSALLLDAAAVSFTKHFYLALATGVSVQAAFDIGRKAVSSMPARLTPTSSARHESSKFVLLGSGDHQTPIWPRLLAGALRDASQPLCATNLPAPSETFVGRQVLMSRAVAALLHGRKRYVCLVGAGGIGKTALALAVAHYVRLRHAFPDGVHHVDCSGLSSSLQLAYALAAALSLQLVGPGEEQVREELIGALAPRRLLIVVDRCDELAEARRAGGGPAAASSSPAGEAAAAAGSPVAELLALVLA